MAYYLTERTVDGPVLRRRPTINEFFLSSYTLNTYTGCELGCPYCDGWAYGGRPLNETISVPLDLPERLAAELPGIDRGDLIAITALSDPYQPAEQTYRITRQVLQLLADRGQPCLILTKSPSVVEDLPLLRKINEQSLAVVMCTLLTTDPYLSGLLEGRSPQPALRLEALAELKRAGIPVGVALVPVMPYVNDTDHSIRTLLRSLAAVPVDFVVWDYLHIPNDRHRARINEQLARIGSYPPSYYRDIYRGQPLPSPQYRAERSAEIMVRCDGFGIEVRAPHKLFADKLRPHNEAALLLKHAAFRDEVQRRGNMATMHRELAELAYTGAINPTRFRASPLWPTLRPILERDAS
jgi:DNA repair photolyase